MLHRGGLPVQSNTSTKPSAIAKRSTSATAGRRSIFDKVGGKADHFTRYGSTQWALCTEETYNELIDKFHIDKWDGFREYESLRCEYESLRFTHNVDAEHNNLFRFKRDKGPNYHPCQKPIDILERLIRCSSNPDDIVLDCFAGSGSTGVACVKTGRQFIGIERDAKYYEIAQQRIEETMKKINQ